MKKAQTEIMGLVIIVMIISVAAIFAVRFILTKDTGVGPEIKLQTQAVNMVSSLIKLDTGTIKFEDIIVDCCDNKNCGFLSNDLPKIINKILPFQKYELELNSLSGNCFKTQRNICKDRVSGSGTISKGEGSYNLIIYLCY